MLPRSSIDSGIRYHGEYQLWRIDIITYFLYVYYCSMFAYSLDKRIQIRINKNL